MSALFALLFRRLLGKCRGALAAATGIALYTLLVGAEPAVLRAALMSGMGLLSRQVGLRQQGLNSLTFTAAFMALFNPHVLWEVGFLLSFMAILGLILYAQPLQSAFERWAGRRLSGPVGEYFLFTLAAQVTTLPVILYTFGRFSLSSFLANPLILPVQPAAWR